MRVNQKFDLIRKEAGYTEKIDMYNLAVWLGGYNRKSNLRLQPSKLQEKHILEYLEWHENRVIQIKTL